MESENLKDLLVYEFRRRVIEESIPRIKKSLSEISEAEVWFRPNENSNAIGNLVLHLCGNARQWVLAGMDAQPDHRQRQTEFDARGGISKADLTDLMDKLQVDLEEFLPRITVENLFIVRRVQVFEETGVSILVHVIEHFSYHTGQIAYAVKFLKNKDLDFYGDMNLEVQ